MYIINSKKLSEKYLRDKKDHFLCREGLFGQFLREIYMVISHLPVGYVTAYLIEKKFWKDFSKKQVLWLYAVLLFFSIFPDFDLAYFWFVNGMFSHREFFTHSLFFYVILGSAVYGVFVAWKRFTPIYPPISMRKIKEAFFLKKEEIQSGSEQKKCSLERFTRWIVLCIIAGALIHLILDSIFSCAGWIFPFYANPIGLPLLDIYFGWIKNYYFPAFMTIELGVAVIALYTLINANLKANKREREETNWIGKFIKLSFYFVLAGAVFLPFATRKSFYMPPDIGNRDFDNDGIKNDRDFDFDNDGIENLYDKDANGNGIGNSSELAFEAAKMEGVYSSGTNTFLRSFLISGTVSDADILINSLEKIGIFLSAEMNYDFMNNSDDYQNAAYNYKFSKDPRNIYAFFKNNDMLICDKQDVIQECETVIQAGDMLFYGSSGHIAIAVDASGSGYSVIEAGAYFKKALILGKTDIEAIYGQPEAIARLGKKW